MGNDWPCGPLAAYLAVATAGRGPGAGAAGGAAYARALAAALKNARSAFCIHNLAYQGVFVGEGGATLNRLCLPEDDVRVAAWAAAARGGDSSSGDSSSEDVNWMRAALATASRVVTVSPTYAEEITAGDPVAACGLHDLLASTRVDGIVNGVDVKEWDPATDARLAPASRFDAACVATGKAAAKAAFQRAHGLDVDPDATLVVYVGRLTDQKGVDVLLAAAPALVGSAHVGAAPPVRAPTLPPDRHPPHPVRRPGHG